MRVARSLTVLTLALAVSACADRGLQTVVKNGRGPDEFLVIPSKPLSEPESYTFLPAPTPGGANITDQNPEADAIAALGGNPAALNSTTIPGSDGALVNNARRYGSDADIRTVLAQEDADFRKRRGRFANIKLFNVDRYADVYSSQTLNADEQERRYRQAGVPTPAAPPATKQ
ncbi:MAG: DUF3035 domain-containing protein [Marinibacterium sp.]|nr:DUF3035 domain-containing protein [Marinibacterium sp.]